MAQDLTQKAYKHLYNKLCQGQLQPGSRLSNRSVAKEIGISFTPVRVAFSQLVSEGLLEHRQGVGVFVPVVNDQEIRESYEFREFLESEAAARACKNLSSIMLAEMAEQNKAMEDIHEKILAADDKAAAQDRYSSDWQAADLAFHMALLRSTGNRRIVDTALNLQTSLTALELSLRAMSNAPEPSESVEQQIIRESQGNIKRTLEEHQRILEALEQRDADAARSLMSKHILSGLELTLISHNYNRVNDANTRLHGSHRQ